MLFISVTAFAQLPAVTLNDIDGNQVKTDTIGTGQPVVISFFATWCKPCNRELNAIAEVYSEWRNELNFRLVAVGIDQAQNIHKVKPLVDENGWEYEVLLDPNSEFKRALGIQMIPYVLVLDGKGNIIYRHNGYTEGAEEEIYNALLSIE